MESKNQIIMVKKKRKKNIKKSLKFGSIFLLVSIVVIGIIMTIGAKDVNDLESVRTKNGSNLENINTEGLDDLENICAKEGNELEALEISVDSKEIQINSDESDGDWVEVDMDPQTGTKYLLHENSGGFWADAEKAPPDDGPGNPPAIPPAVDMPGDEDDRLCWAATASNMLEWTGWGYVGGMNDGNTDDFFQYYMDHVTDYDYYTHYGHIWWFNGTLTPATGGPVEDVPHGGFWNTYNPDTYIRMEDADDETLPNIRNALLSNTAVGLSIGYFGGGGHAVTCWGFNYNASLNPATDKEDYYLGVWLTDSDDNKGVNNPDNELKYYDINYDTTANYWTIPRMGAYIRRVYLLDIFPGEVRPVADTANIVGTEGTPITFDAGGSNDPDGDTLEYRWDFDGDSTWDTAWSASTTATHTWDDDYIDEDYYLEVFDGRLRDVEKAKVTVNNVAPKITLNGDIINENDIATVSGTITDPGTSDTFTLVIDWGEGAPETYWYAAGTTIFSLSHQYLDDNPSGTASDVYTISVTVTDDDGGVGTASTTVTVNNIAPTITTLNGDIINENDVATVSGTISDIGTLDTFTLIIDWGEGAPETYWLPAGTTIFSLNHQYMDDNPSGTASDVYTISVTVTDDDSGVGIASTTVTVNNIAPTVSIDGLEQTQEFDLDDFIIIMLDPVTFIGSATDPGTDDLTFTWDWGDGTPVTSTTYLYSGSPVAITDIQEHIYSGPGEYVVILTVEDDDCGISQATITVKVLGPRDLKQMAISDLEALKTGDYYSDFKINCMIKKIEFSLCECLWIDEIHLSQRWGTKVFCYEMFAIGEMERQIAYNNYMILKLEKIIAYLESEGIDTTCLEERIVDMQEANSVYESVILKLVKADELLARVALEDAENTPVQCPKYQKIVDYKLAKANKHLLLATECVENGQYTKAISHFKHSWIYSQYAIKWANKDK